MNYTADDFKNANIAIRGTRGAARRCEPGTPLPWVCDGEEWDDDKGMVEDGWRPVHEHNPHATDALEEEIQDLRDENGDLKVRLEHLHEELALWREKASLAGAYARAADAKVLALTLDSLREAWENAEVPTEGNPVRVGDALISSGRRGHLIRSAAAIEDGWAPPASYRVLHRARQPEPVQALVNTLNAVGLDIPKSAVRMLHERGVRLVGGDEA